MLNGRNPLMNWCITVSSLTATLAATLALGTSHGFWQRVLFFVILSTTLPALGYFLLIAAYHSNRWMKQRLPALPWRRVRWPVPVGAAAVGVVVLAISQLGGGGSRPASSARASGSQYVAALTGPSDTYNATGGLLAPAGDVAFSADGKTVSVGDCTAGQANGSATGRVYQWSVGTGKLRTSLTVPPHGPPDCGNPPVTAFSRDGKFLATADTNSDVTYLWHAGSHRLAASLDPQYGGGMIADVAFSPDSRTLAVADTSGATALWSTVTNSLIKVISPPSNAVSLSAVTFSPNGKLLALGEYGGKTELVRDPGGTIVTTITDPRNRQNPNSGYAEFATFSHDGKFLATGDGDGRTYLWNAVSRRLTATLSVPGAQGPPGDAPNVLFSPANDTLATSSFYGRVYLWNIMARKLTATFTVPDGAPILGLAFNPNGRTLAINDDRTTYLWKLK